MEENNNTTLKERDAELSKQLRKRRNKRSYDRKRQKISSCSEAMKQHQQELKARRDKRNALKAYVGYLKRVGDDNLTTEQAEVIAMYNRAKRLKQMSDKVRYERRVDNTRNTTNRQSIENSNEGEASLVNSNENENENEIENEVISIDDDDENESQEDITSDSGANIASSFHEPGRMNILQSVLEVFTSQDITDFLERISPMLLNHHDRYNRDLITLFNECNHDEQENFINYNLGRSDFNHFNLSRLEEIRLRGGLEQSKYDRFEHFVWRTRMNNPEYELFICPVCLDKKEDLDKDKDRMITIFTCNGKHMACNNCTLSLIQVQNTCPECRQPFP